MRILSFDVGIKNLAYCIFNSDTLKIVEWDIIDLNVEGFSGKIPSGLYNSTAKAANDIHITLIKRLDTLPILLEVDYIVIEKQPSFNPKMRIIGGCLQSYFYIRGIVDRTICPIKSIEFFSPKHKLKCYTGPELHLESKVKSKYAQTKKMGILIAKKKLEEFDENVTFIEKFETSKKKDDLADCYLQAITFCIFKKFKQNETPLFKSLTKQQIKKQLKEYLDTKIRVYTVSELLQQEIEKNVVEAVLSSPSQVLQSLKTKYNSITKETIISIFTDLSMKMYLYYHYDLTTGFVSNKKF